MPYRILKVTSLFSHGGLSDEVGNLARSGLDRVVARLGFGDDLVRLYSRLFRRLRAAMAGKGMAATRTHLRCIQRDGVTREGGGGRSIDL